MRVTIFYFFLICFLLTSCKGKKENDSITELLNQNMEQKTNNGKLYRFYDFNICVDVISHQGQCVRYLICNISGQYSEHRSEIQYSLKENTLYRIDYKFDWDKINHEYQIYLHPIDTVEVRLTNKQMDKIYTLTHSVFKLGSSKNESCDSIPPPPPLYDGPNAIITFDRCFRGDSFEVNTLPDSNKEFMELNKYFEQLLKKSCS